VVEDRIFYGVGRLELHFPYSRSLKDKRAVMKSLKGRLAERSRIAVVEAGPQDLWQRGSLGLCSVGRDESQVRNLLASLLRIVETDDRVVILSYETRIGSLDDEPLEGES
jgi:uncharacterized protein YlxP (DUF503 family)